MRLVVRPPSEHEVHQDFTFKLRPHQELRLWIMIRARLLFLLPFWPRLGDVNSPSSKKKLLLIEGSSCCSSGIRDRNDRRLQISSVDLVSQATFDWLCCVCVLSRNSTTLWIKGPKSSWILFLRGKCQGWRCWLDSSVDSLVFKTFLLYNTPLLSQLNSGNKCCHCLDYVR